MKAYGKIPFPLFLSLVSYISFQNFFCNYKQCIFLFYPSSLFLILFTTIQHSMIWMFQGLFNQLLLTHWSHPFHAITNNTKHNCTYIKFISECALHEASEVVQDIRLPQGPTFTSLRSQLLFLL